MVLGGLFGSSRSGRVRSHSRLRLGGSDQQLQNQNQNNQQQQQHLQHLQLPHQQNGRGSASTSSTSLPFATPLTPDGSTDAPMPAWASDCIFTEAQLQPIPEPPPDLRYLNNCLDALAAVFPDVQVEVFREMLSHFDGESRLAVVADTLLKSRTTWVKGRWRVGGGQQPDSKKIKDSKDGDQNGAAASPNGVLPHEAFRSENYKKAVRALAAAEFKGLSRSAINGVLAECNFSYIEARPTLGSISSKSWRSVISSLFTRRRTPTVTSSPVGTGGDLRASHPLVMWRQIGRGMAAVPTIRPTGSPELDRELYEALVVPILRQDSEARVAHDHEMALRLNAEDADQEGMVYECSCCYGDVSFEELTACSAEGHLICFGCVQRSVTEAVFGQGWQSSIDTQAGTLKCLSVEGDGCTGHVPRPLMSRAMLEQKKGAEVLAKLDGRLAEHSLLDSKLPLVRCPFCDYAEVDEVYHPGGEPGLRISAPAIYNLVFLSLCLGVIPFLVPVMLLAMFLCVLCFSKRTLGDQLTAEWSSAVARHHRRKVGPKFSCRSPRCGRTSCASCSKVWIDVHVCNESSLIALRTQVEQAMSMAVKRVCPRCSTSFVKTVGCNKLTCPCGYKMCYVCRADLTEEGYRHFCDHFRPEGSPRPCAECDRCNLWENEDTDRVLNQAKEEAEKKWREAEQRELTGAERAFLETGVASASGASVEGGVKKVLMMRRGRGWPALAEVMDWLAGNLLA